MKNSQKMQLNRRIFHNLQSHLACWHIKMCTSIKHTICESLMKIQHFRHECSSFMDVNTKKNKRPSITCSYILYISIFKCVYLLDTYSVKIWWSYVLPNPNSVHLCDIILKNRAMFSTYTNKVSRKAKIRSR